MPRYFGTKKDGAAFDEAIIEAVWQKGTPEPNYPSFRKDVCGASMKRDKHGKQEQWGWEIDHIKPLAPDGTDNLSNLRPLHWENNRAKGDSYPDSAWTCKVTS